MTLSTYLPGFHRLPPRRPSGLCPPPCFFPLINHPNPARFQTLACCAEGCYSVKGEAFKRANCRGKLTGASIANYGNVLGSAAGKCIDIRGDASLKAHNDGCGSSHPDFHFFKRKGCPGGPGGGFKVEGKTGGGECFEKPDGAGWMIVVSN